MDIQCVSKGYPSYMKTAGLRIRVEPNLHKGFLNMCKKNEQSASQVLRKFMKQYVEESTQGSQNDLFDKDLFAIPISRNNILNRG